MPTGRLGPVFFCPSSFSGNRRAALPDGTRERRNDASLVSEERQGPMANFIDNTPSSTPTTSTATDPEECREAFEQLAPAIAAVPAASLMLVNLDVPSAVTTALGAATKLTDMEPELAAALPSVPRDHGRRVRAAALALMHTHVAHQVFVQPEEDFQKRLGHAQELRTKFYADISAAIARGVIDPKSVDEYRGTVGYKVVANDLMITTQIVRAHWPSLAGRTFITEQELDEAETLGAELLTSIGQREQAPLRTTQASLTRQRAFTLFVNTYAEARRTVQYVRFHEGDADSIVPSLYAGRGNANHRRPEDAEEPEPTAPTPAQPAAPPAPATAPSIPVAPAVAPVTASAPSKPAPGAGPFVA
jgi:hypothetical protein